MSDEQDPWVRPDPKKALTRSSSRELSTKRGGASRAIDRLEDGDFARDGRSKGPELFSPAWWEARSRMLADIARRQKAQGIKWTPRQLEVGRAALELSAYGADNHSEAAIAARKAYERTGLPVLADLGSKTAVAELIRTGRENEIDWAEHERMVALHAGSKP